MSNVSLIFLSDVFLHTLYSCTPHSIADASVYPASIGLHNVTVNMIADLWHCPKPPNGEDYAGSGTVGSTEACLLAGMYKVSSMMFFDNQIF